MELTDGQKQSIVQIGRNVSDICDWYMKMCYGVEANKKPKDMFGALETAQMVMGKYQKEGEQESVVSRTNKFEFRADNTNGMYHMLGSSQSVNDRLYYKYADGKNWSDFTREELEYMATKSCADVPRYKMAPEDRKYPMTTSECHKVPIVSRKEAMKIASTLPNANLAELIDNTERIMKWLEEGKV